jgi:predicted O-methyltransferase YrrM
MAALQGKPYLVEAAMRAIELYKTQGVTGLVKGVARYVRYNIVLRTRETLGAPVVRYRDVPHAVAEIHGYKYSPVEAISYVYSHRLLRPQQKRSEIWSLIKLVSQWEPLSILEIGTANGGTLFLFAHSASVNAHLISIDLPGGKFGGGYPVWKIPLYESFIGTGQTLQLIRGDSHSDAVAQKIKQSLDLLYIDGDHTYEGVKRDYEMYGPMVNKGGMIVFHDIVVHPRETGCEVSRFWEEVKQGKRYTEIVEDWNQGSCGIGVLYL